MRRSDIHIIKGQLWFILSGLSIIGEADIAPYIFGILGTISLISSIVEGVREDRLDMDKEK